MTIRSYGDGKKRNWHFAGGEGLSARIGEEKRNAKRTVTQGHWGHSEPIGIDIYMHIIDSKKGSHVRLTV